MFGDFGYSLPSIGVDYLKWVSFFGLALFLLFISLVIRKIWGAKSRKRDLALGLGLGAGMSMMQVEQLRKQGLITEEEFRRIRGSVAKHVVESTSDASRIERERQLMNQIAVNPELARELIDPAKITRPPRQPVTAPAASPTGPAPSSQSARPTVTPAAAKPAPVATPPPAKSESNANDQNAAKPRDLEFLLAKGAISPEEYERLKKFFQ